MTSRSSQALAALLVVVLAGGSFLLLRAVFAQLAGDRPVTAAVLATAVVAPLLLPVYEQAGRLLGGRRKDAMLASYHVLADLATVSRGASTEASDLTGVAEAITRRLGASSCRLSVIHPGVRDRIYAWPEGATAGTDDVAVLPIRHGTEPHRHDHGGAGGGHGSVCLAPSAVRGHRGQPGSPRCVLPAGYRAGKAAPGSAGPR